jgi:hypothetical protein
MICLTLATGVVTGASTGLVARGALRAPATMNPIPEIKSAALITNSQYTIRM